MKDDTTIVRRLIADEPALTTSLDFGPFVAQGTGPGPAVIIGDQSEITLFGTATDTHLDHRMALLAKPGDFVLVRHRDPRFEEYLAERLGITGVTFIAMGTDPNTPVARMAETSVNVLTHLARAARDDGGLTVKSYLTTGNTWRLAKAIGEAAQCVVHVCGPSPRVVRRVNDKLWFARLARAAIGCDATPPTLSAYGPAATAALVAHIGKTAPQVIVKVPDSAGSAGNIKLNSATFQDKTLGDLRDLLLASLHGVGWKDTYPVLVGVWDENVVASPSVQLWIPRPDQGRPIAEAVFEQMVMGEAAAFVGAKRSTLPDTLRTQLVAQATQIADILQQIGYYGRCSFDAVICRDAHGREIIHWIECNGRWGGASIPMTVAHMLSGRNVPGLLILQETLRDLYMSTGELLKRLDDLLLLPNTRTTGIVLLSPALSPNGTLLSVMVLAGTQDTAEGIAADALSRLGR